MAIFTHLWDSLMPLPPAHLLCSSNSLPAPWDPWGQAQAHALTSPPVLASTSAQRFASDFGDVAKGHTLDRICAKCTGWEQSLGAVGGGMAGLCFPHPLVPCAFRVSLGWGRKEGTERFFFFNREIFKDQVEPLGALDGTIPSWCGCSSPLGLQFPPTPPRL